VGRHRQRPPATKEEWRRRELEARGGLDQLVQLLAESAIDAAADRKFKFTNEERKQLRKHSDILSGAAAELAKILIDHPLEHVREYRLAKLFEALGSTTFIASHVVKNKTIDRLRTAPATEKRLENAQQTKTEIIIGEEVDRFRKQYPDEFRKLRRNGRGHHAVANRICESINERCKNELHRKRLSSDRIARYLKKDRHF
jgi:hypothetical protein